MSGFLDQSRDQRSVQTARPEGGIRRKKRLTKPRPLTHSLVRLLFDYHEEGYLTWTSACPRVDRRGMRAGQLSVSSGYWDVMIYGRSYKLHRVIFLWHHGYMPEEVVDHEDRNRDNNKISNLRDVSKTCNNRNCEVRKDNVSGVCGVFWHKQSRKWEAKVRVASQGVTVGRFSDFVEAVKARHAAEVKYNWKGCNSTSSAYLYLKERGLV